MLGQDASAYLKQLDEDLAAAQVPPADTDAADETSLQHVRLTLGVAGGRIMHTGRHLLQIHIQSCNTL